MQDTTREQTSSRDAITHPGVGSRTLYVEAYAKGFARSSKVLGTSFEVMVMDSEGKPIDDAVVTFTLPQVGALVIPSSPGEKGLYGLGIPGYTFGPYYLDVTRGRDNIKNACVMTPDVHEIISPLAGQTISKDSNFSVMWRCSVPADSVVIWSKDFGPQVIYIDDGHFTLPASLKKRDDGEIGITRINRVSLDGGLGGSFFEISLENKVESLIIK